jgi:anthranilate phosphoribosyltransferase
LDELTTTGPSFVAELKDGAIRSFEVMPEDVGLAKADLADLVGGDAQENATAIRAVLAGKAGAFRDIVVLNAGAALVVAGLADTLVEGVDKAAAAIDSGAAAQALEMLIKTSNA